MKNPLFQMTDRSFVPMRTYLGGSWISEAWFSRITFRDVFDSPARDHDQGFRLFRTLEKS